MNSQYAVLSLLSSLPLAMPTLSCWLAGRTRPAAAPHTVVAGAFPCRDVPASAPGLISAHQVAQFSSGRVDNSTGSTAGTGPSVNSRSAAEVSNSQPRWAGSRMAYSNVQRARQVSVRCAARRVQLARVGAPKPQASRRGCVSAMSYKRTPRCADRRRHRSGCGHASTARARASEARPGPPRRHGRCSSARGSDATLGEVAFRPAA
jgi:hypothetical protein